MQIYKDLFSKRFQKARELSGLKQSQIAEKLGVKPSTVSRWETGADLPDDSRLPEICKILRVPLSFFEAMPEVNPAAPHNSLSKVPDVIEFLSKFSKLLPAQRDLVLAVTYDDDSMIVDGDEADWPQWLSERLKAQSK